MSYFKYGAENNDAPAMMRAYTSYEIYKRSALTATQEARADYVREGGKAEVIMDFYGIGSGGDASRMFISYAHAIQRAAKS